MEFTIRPAKSSDTIALANLLRDIGFFDLINRETVDQTKERVAHLLALCLADDSHSMYVAETNPGEIMGYLSVHWLPYLIHRGPEGYVSELFVRAEARGQGIGSQLLETAVAEGRRRGCGRMMLVNVRSRESYQRGFYKKLGWEERQDAANFVLYL